jgi:polar amino acid transport system substrate-binding protein
MHLSKTPLLSGVVLLAFLALLAAGCGGSKKKAASSTTSATTTSSTSTSSAANVKTDSKIAAMVPAKLKSKTVVVAADATYAPNEFIGSNGKTVVGWDPELTQALAKVMGVNAKVVNATFATIIPGLQSGKYDLGISSFTDTKEREKVVDFVTYFTAGTSFYVKAQGGPTINTLADLCGHSVAVETGTTQLDDATAQDKKCKSSGKSGVTVKGFPDQNAANLAISSGREQVGMADSPVAAYIVKQSSGKFKLSGKSYNNAPYGIAIPKGSGMAKPIQEALKELISNGTYLNILKKWGVQEGAIKNPQINAAVS